MQGHTTRNPFSLLPSDPHPTCHKMSEHQTAPRATVWMKDDKSNSSSLQEGLGYLQPDSREQLDYWDLNTQLHLLEL